MLEVNAKYIEHKYLDHKQDLVVAENVQSTVFWTPVSIQCMLTVEIVNEENRGIFGG